MTPFPLHLTPPYCSSILGRKYHKCGYGTGCDYFVWLTPPTTQRAKSMPCSISTRTTSVARTTTTHTPSPSTFTPVPSTTFTNSSLSPTPSDNPVQSGHATCNTDPILQSTTPLPPHSPDLFQTPNCTSHLMKNLSCGPTPSTVPILPHDEIEEIRKAADSSLHCLAPDGHCLWPSCPAPDRVDTAT